MGQGGQGARSGHARELIALLRRYLLAHSRGLLSEHDDLIQQTLEDYYRLLDRSSSDVSPEHEPTLLISIARRRIADRYRQLTRRAIVERALDDYAAIHTQPDAAATMWYQALLQNTLLLIAELDGGDQDLLLNDQTGREALSAAQRQRLSRLRRRLRGQLAQRFQLSVDDDTED